MHGTWTTSSPSVITSHHECRKWPKLEAGSNGNDHKTTDRPIDLPSNFNNPKQLTTMARARRGGGAPARRPAAPSRPQSRPASTSARTPAPAAPSSVAAPAKSGGMLSGIGSTIAQGMAFGTGSAIAHQAVGAAVGSMSGGGSKEEAPQEQAQMPAQGQGMSQSQDMGACSNDKSNFYDCLNHNKGDQQSCTFLYEQLQQCQQSTGSSSQMQFS